ncbi:MAG TPA: hypothetical protein PLQ28_00700 [Flexilinea sp.]|nr:hypothetical protein [Flexilinea sp.]HOW06323.1 hypothetical protein [Flexilinea sp.]HPS46943.1 hypothetical protein [Flexilinea sp.]
MPLVYFLVVAALIYSAHKATRVKGLLNAALWLAGTSCLTSILVYILGSPGLAVIELSVGAGLVTVLFVFAISIIGDEKITSDVFVPHWLAISISVVSFGMLAYFLIAQHMPSAQSVTTSPIFSDLFWEGRKIDIYLQGALFISGILGILLLIAPAVSKRIKEGKNK